MRRRRLAALGALASVIAAVAASAGPVRAASSYIVQDTFQRANQTGSWGTASDGMTWSSGTGLAVSSDEGVITNLTSSSDFETLGSGTTADGNGLVRFAVTNSDIAGMILRHQANGNMDLVRYDGSGQFQFMVKSGGSWTVVSTTAYPISNSAFYWLRFEVQGSSVSYRIWPASGTEPSTWTWSGTSSTITTAGTMGLYGYAPSGSEDEFDSFSVAPVGVVTGPTAAVTLNLSSTPAGGSVTANASGSAPGTYPISTYTFNFGDGTTLGPQPGATASHVYANGGVFTVTVNVTDTAGNSSQATAQETVGQPVAALTVTPSSGSPPLAVTASASGSTDTTGVAITAYTFNFGDGTIVGPQTSSTAGHTYTIAAGYTVTLTVTDSTGATSSATAPVTVRAVTPPGAALTLNPNTPAPAGSSITANASASSAGTYPISTYTFNFGDGTTLGPQPGATASHVYANGGVFTVTVTVTDTAGNSSQATAQETVGQPVAALTVTPSSGSPPLAVTASASGSTDTTGVAITAYTFNFGDGTTVGPQTTPTAGHTYTLAGTYTVSLTVTDTTGATATQTQTATAATPPTAALNVSPSSGTAPLTVSADASGSAAGSHPISSYTFSYGDGTVDGPQAADMDSHIYLAPGTFTVTLTVADSAGLTSSATHTVTVTSTYIVQDTFQRANQTGWGTASDGLAWSVASGTTSGGALSISANEGLISNSGQYSTFETIGAKSTANANGLVRFALASPADALGMLLRLQTNGSGELVRYNGGQFQFMVKSGGGWTVMSSTAYAISTNTFYWLRFDVQGSNDYYKIWPASGPEPTSWTWSGTNSTITTAGTLGLYGYAQSGAPVSFDSFSVAPVSAAPPNSTIAGTVQDSTTGSGIAGVTVSTTPASTTATTSSSGAYSLPVASGTYTVVFTASSLGYNDNDLANVTAPAGGGAVASQTLLAIPGPVAMDTFTQPDQSGGWSPSTDGHTWTSDLGSPPNGVPAKAGITANQAWVDTSGSTLEDVDSWMGYQYANQEVSADVDTTAVLSDPKYQHGPRLLARVQASGTAWNAIVMTIDPPDGSNPTCPAGDLSLWVTVPSTWTQLATVCQTVSTGTLYHAKLDVVGNLIEGKVWASGTIEPGWQISATQTSPNQITGPGVSGTRTTGSYVDWANFQEAPITQISGQVTAASNGTPIVGATVTLSNGLTTTTDTSGAYSFSGLPATLPGGTAYTVTVAATGYTTGSSTITTTVGGTTTANLNLA